MIAEKSKFDNLSYYIFTVHSSICFFSIFDFSPDTWSRHRMKIVRSKEDDAQEHDESFCDIGISFQNC